eukprot:20397-Heterococcus_DN1.PRE.5
MKHDMQHTRQPAAANTGMNMMNVEKSAPAILATALVSSCMIHYTTTKAGALCKGEQRPAELLVFFGLGILAAYMLQQQQLYDVLLDISSAASACCAYINATRNIQYMSA